MLSDMTTIILISTLLMLLIVWEIDLRMRKIFGSGSLEAYIQTRIHRMAKMLLLVGRVYKGVYVRFSSAVEDELPDRFLIVSNHQSIIDIVILLYLFPDRGVRFVAKDSLARGLPAISMVLRTQSHALINRKSSFRQTTEILKDMAREDKPYTCPLIFPEGTRSQDGSVKTFQTGAIRMLQTTRALPVVSVALDGGYHAARADQLLSNLKNLCYRVRILNVHQAPRTKSEITAQVRQCEQEIRRQVEQWHSQPLSVPFRNEKNIGIIGTSRHKKSAG